ncbi:MAG: WhiB family transcriptional regulator [Ancrocorticia sp.]|uniref:WhiB family transcriptional regulator n=1 Tax=Ancrocorticia sp. TaxID=2593684 RepID=UPI003F8DB88C
MSVMEADQTWAVYAACAHEDPDALFVRGAAQREVRQVCFSCPVRVQCLADALDSGITFGVWGGLTERERRALVRQCPEEEDWADRLASGTDELAEALRNGKLPRLGRAS